MVPFCSLVTAAVETPGGAGWIDGGRGGGGCATGVARAKEGRRWLDGIRSVGAREELPEFTGAIDVGGTELLWRVEEDAGCGGTMGGSGRDVDDSGEATGSIGFRSSEESTSSMRD